MKLQPTAAALATALALMAVCASCGGDGDTTGPGEGAGPGIEIVAGAGTTDTIEAAPAQALVVGVRAPAGEAVSGAVVRFEALPSSKGPPSMWVGRLSDAGYSLLAVDTLDGSGRGEARIRFGGIAGNGRIRVVVPEFGFEDTATYTVEPGQAAVVVSTPADTAVFVGGSYHLQTVVTDRRNNARTDAVTYEIVGGAAMVSAEGTLTGSGVSRGVVLARAGKGVDTVFVSVVPEGAAAGIIQNEVAVLNLDGSKARTVWTNPDRYNATQPPAWFPGSADLLVYTGAQTFARFTLDGASTPFLAGDAQVPGNVDGFRFTRDGRFLYFSAGTCNYSLIVYRTDLAAKVTTRISPPGDDCYETADHAPSPSPDGRRLVVGSGNAYAGPRTLMLLDAATGQRTDLKVKGERPAWSPKGDLIAYWLGDAIYVVRPDGSQSRRISPDGVRYDWGVDWTGDGEWVLAHGAYGGTLELLRASDGLRLPLVFAKIAHPSFRAARLP